ncbi:motility associated factor glycosyltransferase family protein [Paenibacillus sp. PL91]|uniref:motility associated factor glycosyltransferase family protein n=1 Tax=Paenibacillus sp. PL91 TaxID=2729538 RepID=UPI00145DB095|nr:6-hydroxymethylpterin diphosphokinase MptE-like protein [Paenibacillus sp. PL91]MBC9201909.1 motility associated factor glycosyltransferase family protein [Paenibacillus sp. PL91]
MSVTILDRNIDVISRNPNHWIGQPKEDDIHLNFIGTDEEGNELLFINNQIIIIKNEFDESNMPNDNKKELIILVGINSLEEIEKHIQTMSKESYLLIIEPNFSFFNHALNKQDLNLFNNLNVILFADDLKNLSFFLDNLLSTTLIYYIKNIKFYFTYFYREYSLDSCIAIVKKVKEIIHYKAMLYGNSIEDSMIGFRNNIKNINCLTRSKDVSQLKRLFENKPAVVVSAGPSLNKNIEQLKKMKNKAVIIAVDTIASRLCDEGIIPDFICSIERGKETYTYFYENKNYPSEITLVGPLVLHPQIFEEYQGNIVIPMREKVGEYNWIQDVFGISKDSSISIGLSCAHVAFGFAEHIGASPIVLMGQDLAFGDSKEESHAGGTIYDNKEFTNNIFSSIDETIVEGYYGGYVTSNEIWINFRKWFEKEIFDKNLFVINATEGGAKIANTLQMSLAEVLNTHCSENLVPVLDILKNVASNPLNQEQMKIKIEEQIEFFSDLKIKYENQLINIKRLKITNISSEKELQKTLKKLEKTDPLFRQVTDNWLLRHILQPALMTAIWNLYDIEQILSSSNLNRNKEIQVEFLSASVFVLAQIISILSESLDGFK